MMDDLHSLENVYGMLKNNIRSDRDKHAGCSLYYKHTCGINRTKIITEKIRCGTNHEITISGSVIPPHVRGEYYEGYRK